MLEAELFAFLENTADAVFVIRDTGEICFWNHSAETLFGFSAEEVIGKTCYTVLHGVGALGTQVCLERCSAFQCAKRGTHTPNFDLNVVTRNTKRIWVNISSIIFSNRRTAHTLLVHIARDISGQKHREELFQQIVGISREISALEDAVTGTAPVAPLSVQELEILRMFAAGTTASRIAKTLGISPQTLRNHLHHINQKLRTHNRLEAVMHALQRRLI
ncbi:MAG: LuxR C-terminal-related transcriptional regulator [Terracidiphilus sp.]